LLAEQSTDEINYDNDETAPSTLRSLTFCLGKDQEPDLLCDFLMELGACSTSLTDADRGTDQEVPLFGEPSSTFDPWRDTLQWAMPVWNRCNVTAHFPDSISLTEVLDLIATTFPDQYDKNLQQYAIERVPNKDWVIHVQKGWAPIVVSDKTVLRFPWHTDEDVEQELAKRSLSDRSNVIELKLQGGIAFGTGEHPTTQLCLDWIHSVIPMLLETNEHVTVMDYGAGSGVLGMAACAVDPARVTAVGIDIDFDSCRIANANAITNGVSMRNYLPPVSDSADDESKSLLFKAHRHARLQLERHGDDGQDILLLTSDDPSSDPAKYHVCVANILAGPLMTLASTLAGMVLPGGYLGLSGILPQQADDIISAYGAAGFVDLSFERELNGWILVTGRKPST